MLRSLAEVKYADNGGNESIRTDDQTADTDRNTEIITTIKRRYFANVI